MRRLLLAGTLLLAACTSQTGTSTTLQSMAETTAAPTSTAPAATVSTTAPPTTEPAPNPLEAGIRSVDRADVVFDAIGIDGFRSTSSVLASADPEQTEIILQSEIQSAYQRTPAAVEMLLETAGAGVASTSLELRAIEEAFWVRQDGGDWASEPSLAPLLSLANVSLLSPEALETVLPVLEEVGQEEVGGRQALHVRGGMEPLRVFLSAAGVSDLNRFSELQFGEIDLWLDLAGFVSKAEYRFGGVRAVDLQTEYYRAGFELSGFDEPVSVEPPG